MFPTFDILKPLRILPKMLLTKTWIHPHVPFRIHDFEGHLRQISALLLDFLLIKKHRDSRSIEIPLHFKPQQSVKFLKQTHKNAKHCIQCQYLHQLKPRSPT